MVLVTELRSRLQMQMFISASTSAVTCTWALQYHNENYIKKRNYLWRLQMSLRKWTIEILEHKRNFLCAAWPSIN